MQKKKNILIPNKNGDFKVADVIRNKDQLLSLTLRQLRQEASKLSVPLYSRKTKAVLVDLILKYQEKSPTKTNISTSQPNSANNFESNTFSSSEEVKTNVVFLPRDPDWAYVFWQISDDDREKAQSLGANKLCLRLFDASGFDGSNLNQGTLREIAVDSYSTEWYLPIPLADRDYKVELGYKYGFNWMSLAFSSISHVPASHPSEQILDKFVPFNLDASTESIPEISNPVVPEQTGMHERLYQAATNIPRRRKVGSEEFMENVNSTNLNDNLTDSGAGKWSSGLNESGSGIVKNRSFWLVADAELIVYGATEPSAKLTIGGEDVPLAADGTFRIQVPFRDGTQKYDIKAVDVSGEQEKSISIKFDRTTPLDDTNEKDKAETEWF
ncbi:hypothetical protein EU97_1399 [Prochlorococcus marinus str. MIT 9311]|nr:hypothetical protein EU97_1399 [Prochlorococcus marinus str. MIT 9311]